MHESSLPPDRSGVSCCFWFPLCASLLFAVAHTQAGHYYSNQNQYYLHGLALAGYGDLSHDWLANTTDPTPVFSGMVSVLYRTLGDPALWVVYFLMQVIYFLSLWRIGQILPFFPRTRAGEWTLAAGLIVGHSAAIRIASVAVWGVDYPWYGQAGIANQYLLGSVLQPSVFGVLLLTALAAYSADRTVLAAVCVAGACGLHSTYLLPGALLVAGMMFGLLREQRLFPALRTGGVALLGVVPTIAYVIVQFGPVDTESFVKSQEILAWVRIPHHTQIAQWLDGIAGLQIVGMACGIALFRRTRLFPVLLVSTVFSVLLTLLQWASGSAMLALLFPWRLSVVLVPLALLALCTGLAQWLERLLPAFLLKSGGLALIVGMVLSSVLLVRAGFGYQESRAETELLEAVTVARRDGELYLLPTRFPAPSPSRGSSSSTFLPKKATASANIFELQRFRLATGAAIYADFKSIPYRDADVREWYQRVAQTERWYATPDWDTTGILDEITEAGVTHVVVPAGTPIESRRLRLQYSVPTYRVYTIALSGNPKP